MFLVFRGDFEIQDGCTGLCMSESFMISLKKLLLVKSPNVQKMFI